MSRAFFSRQEDRAAFTMVEMMISMGASCVILGGLLVSSITIQRAVQASSRYAGDYSDQRRLLDYLGRDLRRAVSISATDSSGTRYPLTAGTAKIADLATLILTLPGYYKSNAPGNSGYNEALGVVGTNERLDYGTSGAAAPPVEVVFRRIYVGSAGCVCFVRQEASRDEIIVRKADQLEAEVSLEKGGRYVVVRAAFHSTYSSRQPLVSTYDEILLRNPPLDLHP